LIRWALTIVIMVFLKENCVAQILDLLLISVIFQILLAIENPMIEKSDRRLTWMIEASVSIYLYVLLSLTDFMGEKTQARSSDVKVKFKVKAKVIEKSKYTRRLRACTRRHCILIYSPYT